MDLGREGMELGREGMEVGAGKAQRQGQEAVLSHCMHPQRAESKEEVGLGSKASRHTPGTHFLQ